MEYRLTHTILKHRSAGALRLVAPEKSGAKPVIVLHGLGSAKERMLTNLYAFAAAGFDTVAFDLFLHGDRPDAAEREQRLAADFVGTLGEIIYETAADVPVFCAELGIDLAAAGLLGISAGGFASHVIATQPVQCRALVAAISSPDWLRIDPSRTPDPGSPEGMLLEAASPVNSPQAYPGVAVCMLNNALDDTVSPVGSQSLYERLMPLYAAQSIADKLNFTLYPEAGHFFSDDMLAQSVKWFRRFV